MDCLEIFRSFSIESTLSLTSVGVTGSPFSGFRSLWSTSNPELILGFISLANAISSSVFILPHFSDLQAKFCKRLVSDKAFENIQIGVKDGLVRGYDDKRLLNDQDNKHQVKRMKSASRIALRVSIMNTETDRIIFVAVIHTDHDSIEHARSTVKKEKPDVVAVELDKERYEILINESEEKEIPEPSGNAVDGLLYQIALLEKNLGQVIGSGVGNEMRAAIDEGRGIGAKIALVDRPLKETVRALMKVPLDEIYKLMGLIPQATEEIEGQNAFDFVSMLKDEGTVDNLMDQFETEFPALFDVLVKQRDEYVAQALLKILNDVKGKIVVVLGAGHIDGVKSALERLLITESAS
jgi:hypothetical protein